MVLREKCGFGTDNSDTVTACIYTTYPVLATNRVRNGTPSPPASNQILFGILQPASKHCPLEKIKLYHAPIHAHIIDYRRKYLNSNLLATE
jgi:hypothetical protein